MSLLLNVQNIAKHYSAEPVLSDVSFEVRRGQHISLIGPNGAGKTTLFKILTGEEDQDRGELQLAKNATMGVLKQRPDIKSNRTVWEEAKTAMNTVLELAEQINSLSQQIADATEHAERLRLSDQMDALQTEINNRGGYEVDFKIEKILGGLGFEKSTYEQPVTQLSGGQLNRLMLAKLLLEEPDLMLLDEPSNHLDISATEWLEDFLKQSKQAFVLISHDRYFLDRVVDSTLELVNGTVDRYPAKYTKYLQLKADRLEVQKRTFEKQQIEIAKLEDFVRRHHHGQKHAQAEDRRKKLERIELVEVPREIVAPPMKFAQATRAGDIVLRVKDLAKSFGENNLFEGINLQIERGERWGILGPNGCGKTTFLRCLLGDESADKGESKIGTGVQLGYFDQQLGCVDSESIAAEAIRPSHKEMVDLERHDLLAKFGITGDLGLQKISSMSGGERNRVALAFLAAQDANFLILDEPTNHLDLWARHSLEAALKKFEGTILIVSHDRYFINQVCDHLIVFEQDRVNVFKGNYETYRMIQTGKPLVREETSNKKKKKQPKIESEAPKKPRRRFPYRKVADIEADIAAQEIKVGELQMELSSPEVLRNGDRVIEVKNLLEDETNVLEELYAHWEEAVELN